MESGKVVLGVLAGVAIGAALGILLAPEKGSVTRRQILSKGEDYSKDFTNKFDDLMESISKSYEGALQQAEDLKAKGKASFAEIKREIANGVS